MGAVGVDAGAGLLGLFPGIPVLQEGGVKGPSDAGQGIDRVDEALLLPIVKDAVTVLSRFDVEVSVAGLAIVRHEGCGRDFEEPGDGLYLSVINPNPPLPIAARAAHPALKGLQGGRGFGHYVGGRWRMDGLRDLFIRWQVLLQPFLHDECFPFIWI